MKKGTRFTRVNWQQWDHLLGTMLDKQLAEKIGVTKKAVSLRRNKLNIPTLYQPPPSDEPVIYCECGCGLTLTPFNRSGKPRRFLSGHWANTQPKTRIALTCDNCGKNIERVYSKAHKLKYHYCDHRCEGEHATKIGKRHGKNNGHYNTITVPCHGCGNPVSKAVSLIKRRNNRVYCPDCIPLTRKGRNGFYVGYPKEFSPALRHQIRKRDNFTCQNCFAHQDSVSTLHVHHIDYNKFNNNLMNLIALCVKCHGQTNWALESWKDKFTHLMKVRFPLEFQQ